MRTHRESPPRLAALWLRRRRVGGRTAFIWLWLVPRFTVPLAVLATLLRALTEPFRWPHFVLHLVVNVVGAGLLGGYLAGRVLWATVVAREQRPPRRRA